MTPPEMSKTPLVRPYVGLNAGVINYPNSPLSPSVTAEGGLKLKKDNWDAQAGVRVGTDIGASLSAGYTLPISERSNTSLKFKVGGDYTVGLAKSESIKQSVTIDGQSHSVEASAKPDLYKGYAGVGVNFAPSDKVNITVGAEGGIRGGMSAERYSSLNHTKVIVNGEVTNNTLTQSVGFRHKATAYGTPTVGVEYKPNKNLSLGLNADLNEMGARVAWTF